MLSSSCAGFAFRKVSRVITQHFDTALKPSGLLITQFTILVAVAQNRSIAISELSEILMMDRTTLTRNLGSLVRQGWVVVASGQDKRTHIIRLTENGERVLAEALPLWQQAQEAVMSLLGDVRWSDLLEQLNKLTGLAKTN